MTDTTTADLEGAELEQFIADFKLDHSKFTLADIEDLEIALDYPMSECATRPGGMIRQAAAIVYIRRRKIDPDFTMEDARALPVEVMIALRDELLQVGRVEVSSDDFPPVPAIE